MAAKNFLKENFVLIIGITLPILLMFGFMVAASIPQTLADPPKYDLIFAVNDYEGGNTHDLLNVQLVVNKEGVLNAQYTKNQPNSGSYWKKLYRYDAATKKVHELAFGLPADADKIDKMKEEPVEATAGLKLDTTTTSPDGYSLNNQSYYGHGGLFNEVFWGGGGYSSEAHLSKSGANIKLMEDNGAYFGYGNVEFLGWVKGKK